MAAVSRRCEQAVSGYESIRAQVRGRGAEAPALDDDLRVRLIGASIPGSSVLATLRLEAHRASSARARRCRWFRDLAAPEDLPVAMLAVFPHLAAAAEREGSVARARPIRAAVGGTVVGGLFGSMVHWSDGLYDYTSMSIPGDGTAMLGYVVVAAVAAVLWYRGGVPGMLGAALSAVAAVVSRLVGLASAAFQWQQRGSSGGSQPVRRGAADADPDRGGRGCGCLVAAVLLFVVVSFAIRVAVVAGGYLAVLVTAPSRIAMGPIRALELPADALLPGVPGPVDVALIAYMVLHAALGGVVGYGIHRQSQRLVIRSAGISGFD